MKAQLCWYRPRFSPDRITAIAFLHEFNSHEIQFIVEGNGNRVDGKDLWEYELINAPLAYIDMSNKGDL